MSPSEKRALALVTDLPSPEPFRRLGVPLEFEVEVVAVTVFDLRLLDRGLGGRLLILVSPRGG